ncbi:sigma-54-dependent transcriptional regulator [Oricola thermophila]|uniref:DNA-binding transcriptional regulator NtrC n=1 Tax=Oricola thermophila TaxID=2742145 RepID=A0A6N1VIY5_9HYPH|nr:sigma-54 dependent transcriptional regulator [Oricola thermophila]QKV20383.1 sigma-54-dependent Fis family transcriptional regulator [Oricola thermophila]
MSAQILIVDDDPVQRRLLEAAVERLGHTPRSCDGGAAALDAVENAGTAPFDAMLLDLVMPDIDGLTVMRSMRERDVNIPVIVLTAQGGIDVVITAMRAGAFDFLVKPVSPERLATALDAALKVNSKRVSSGDHDGASAVRNMVAGSEAMDRVKTLMRKAAATDIPVLIEGESGVGKELIARAIQADSPRKNKPFVVVNCGAIPENLIESILFGHEKGAFTGATEKHTGKFVEANGGTLFLDEIGELPLDAQVKLLRAIQEGEIEPVGAKTPKKVNIRIISATNRDLIAAIKEGRFREDLFYRLNVFPIMVPPLRQRVSDIPQLVHHFIEMYRREEPAFRARGISPRALSLLQAHDWPGNIRQLQNAVFRAMVLCEGNMLGEEDFPQISAQVHGIDPKELEGAEKEPTAEESASPRRAELDNVPSASAGDWIEPAGSWGTVRLLDEDGNVRPLVELECEAIAFAIDHYGGQMSEVARRLGIGRSTLYRKLKEYNLGDTGVAAE